MTLGILVPGKDHPLEKLDAYSPLGLRSVSYHFWQDAEQVDWGALAEATLQRGWTVSSLSVYGNPLGSDEGAHQTGRAWNLLIEAASRMGAPLVSGFAGRVPGKSVPDSIEPWKSFFGPVFDRASAKGLQVAFENCRMGGAWKNGNWNLAYCPEAWELMDRAIPGTWFLEWEPGHAVLGLADPWAQIKDWRHRVIHLHGKDAVIDQTSLAQNGAFGGKPVGRYCLPGEGAADWKALVEAFRPLATLRSLDIELPEEPASLPALARSVDYLAPFVTQA